jgi:hypothetical protein
MTTGILEHRTEEQRPVAQEPSSPPALTPPARDRGRALVALSAAVGLLAVYSLWGVQSSRSTLGTQKTAISDLSGKLAALSTENATLKMRSESSPRERAGSFSETVSAQTCGPVSPVRRRIALKRRLRLLPTSAA